MKAKVDLLVVATFARQSSSIMSIYIIWTLLSRTFPSSAYITSGCTEHRATWSTSWMTRYLNRLPNLSWRQPYIPASNWTRLQWLTTLTRIWLEDGSPYCSCQSLFRIISVLPCSEPMTLLLPLPILISPKNRSPTKHLRSIKCDPRLLCATSLHGVALRNRLVVDESYICGISPLCSRLFVFLTSHNISTVSVILLL